MKKVFHTLQALTGEVFALLRLLLLYPFTEKSIEKPRPGLNVLCVHGHLHNGSAWGALRRRLQKGGIGPVDTLSYPSLVLDIPQSGLRVRDRILEIKSATGRDVEILIGHSEGGLVALEYALQFAPKGKITTVVTLGAPLQGTYLAKVGFGPAGKQMRLGSEYLKQLRERLANAPHVRLYSIASRVDGVIRPPASAVWPEYPHQFFDNLGHAQLLFSKKVADAILRYIRSTG
jgi:triacylglycerol lipase